jgi:hypothetical protein
MCMKRVLLAAMSLGVLGVSILASTAEARLISGRNQQHLTGLKAATLEKATLETDCCAPKEPCCPEPCLVYRHCGPKLCCGCEPPKEIVLKVKDPCTGCEIDVPVCAPACCEGEPEVCAGKGFLCRDKVEYEWCCGFRVTVVFRKCDVLVRTWGH